MFRRVAPRPGNVWGQVGGSDVKLEDMHQTPPESGGPPPGEAPWYEPRYLEEDKARISRYVEQNPETFSGVWI